MSHRLIFVEEFSCAHTVHGPSSSGWLELGAQRPFLSTSRARPPSIPMADSEVLSDEGKFERRCGLPGHAKIELSVGSYLLIVDRAYVASIRVQLQLRGQVQR